MTGEQWCSAMPCVELFSSGVVLNQPLSTLLVYALGLVWFWMSLRFLKTSSGQISKRWWSLSLALGGLAALSAGTSYQAFGYELKCAGRELCVWTTWWEIFYMIIQVASLNAMLVAVAYACSTGFMRRAMLAYAGINFLAHFSVTVAGVLLPNRFMLSFDLLLVFTAPTFAIYFLINGLRYLQHKLAMDAVLLISWVLLVGANVFYFAYLSLGLTNTLWERGTWFSENDVLHVAVLVWLLYVGFVVIKHVKDAPQSASQHGNQ